jgi:D-alanyl-D-alanine carboxypeptidase
MKIKIVHFSFFLMLASSSYSQSLNKAKLDSLFSILEQKNKAMGSLTVVKNDQVLYSNSIGYSYISENEKIKSTSQTKYRVGSISKMFTAVMIFQLIDEGKLTLETTLHKYLPDFSNAKTITIGNMLNHRSGLHNFTARADYEAWSLIPKTQQEMLNIIAQGGADFMPNTKTEYSNSNFYVLGYLVEKITKKSYAENLKERITSKIGLTSTEVGQKTDIQKSESYSYLFMDKWIQKTETDITITGGAGCIISTTKDLCQFVEALFHLKLISKSSLSKMITVEGEVGMGIFPLILEKKKSWGHSGMIDGFSSSLVFFPEDSVAIASCSNAGVQARKYMFDGAIPIFYNFKFNIPDFKGFIVPTETLKTYVGMYSCKDLPLKISITQDSIGIRAQATGQSSFPLEAISDDTFKFEQANLTMEFNAERKTLVFKQNGATFLFKKEE